jgi:hypothetical protein
MTRCVRREFLLEEGPTDRKKWIDDRIAELAQIFALAVGGFSVMNDRLNLLLRLDPKVAERWSDEEVVRRWGRLFPPRDKARKPLPVTEAWVQDRLKRQCVPFSPSRPSRPEGRPPNAWIGALPRNEGEA